MPLYQDHDDDRVDPEKKSWTLDDTSAASNPGRIRLQPLCWVRHYPRWPLLLAFGLAATVAWAVWLHWSGWIAVPLFIFANWIYWTRSREHFVSGCINASMVIGLSPMRIAVSTDLGNDEDDPRDYPAVKIIEVNLTTVVGSQPRVGMHLATVALYGQSLDEDGEEIDLPYWDDFHPVPVECATTNHATQQRVLDSIDDSEFKLLEAQLEQLRDPPATGLHTLWSDATTETRE